MFKMHSFTLITLAITLFGFSFGATTPPTVDKCAAIKKGLLKFSLDLIEKLNHNAKPDENILVSPLSIYEALALLHLGSDGETKEELSKVLGFQGSDSEFVAFHENIGSLLQNIVSNDNVEQTNISIGAAAFVRNGIKIKPTYLEQIKTFAGALVENVDFSDGAAATKHINKWISDQTKGRISEMISSVDPNVLLILATTLYFNAKWENHFPDYKTETKKFNSGAGVVEVPFLSDTRSIPYYKNAELKFQAISLAYQNKKFRFYALLPDESSDVHVLTEALNADEFKNVIEQSEKNSVEVDLQIPKLKFKWDKMIKNTLTELGLKHLFDNANLRNLLEGTSATSVSEVQHAATIEVYEYGTEAAAATVVHLLGSSFMAPSQNPPVKFVADRPFLFVIYDIVDGATLFSGIVHKP